MKEKTRKTIIFSLLPLAVLWAIFNMTDSKKQTKTPISNEIRTGKPEAAAIESAKIDTEKYISLPWGKDPFYRIRENGPLPPSPTKKPRWHLAGILFGEANPYAVVNNAIVTEGDMVDGARVVLIDKSTVTLEKDGFEIKLKVAKDKS